MKISQKLIYGFGLVFALQQTILPMEDECKDPKDSNNELAELRTSLGASLSALRENTAQLRPLLANNKTRMEEARKAREAIDRNQKKLRTFMANISDDRPKISQSKAERKAAVKAVQQLRKEIEQEQIRTGELKTEEWYKAHLKREVFPDIRNLPITLRPVLSLPAPDATQTLDESVSSSAEATTLSDSEVVIATETTSAAESNPQVSSGIWRLFSRQ